MNFYSSFKRHLAIVAVIVALGFFTWNTTPFAEDAKDTTDWHQWRGPDGNGISTEKGWLSVWSEGEPKQLWKISVGNGYSSVTVSDGRIYTMGNAAGTDTVYCLDANTGDEIWKYSYACKTGDYKGTRATPTIDGKYVYTLSREGHLFCFNATSGRIKWSKNLKRELNVKSPKWGFACSPLILNNLLIVDVGITVAFNKTTGRLAWKSKDYGAAYSSPFAFNLGNHSALAVFPAFGLVILNAKNGQELRRYPWETKYGVNAVTPIVSDGKAFISSGYGTGCALLNISGNKPTVIWQNKDMSNHFNNCVLWEGHLYGFDEKTLKCLDFQTGEVKWSQRGLGKGSLMLADGKLIVLGDRGQLVVAKASPVGFNEISRAKVLEKTCWTVPVLSGGKIYCRNDKGDLVCLDVSSS